MQGTLFLVATPIGNLEDISFRAISTLNSVELIASENTMHSGRLLAHYKISKHQISYHDFNKEHKTPKIIDTLKNGGDVALITDAGTPGIADPAFYVVREAIKNDIKITSIPGPTACISALISSGLPTDSFVFENFAPAKGAKRRKLLDSLKEEKRTIIFYESPHRIVKLLIDIKNIYGNIHVVIARELTKMYEEILRDNVENLIDHFSTRKPKGEFTVIYNLHYAPKSKDHIKADEFIK